MAYFAQTRLRTKRSLAAVAGWVRIRSTCGRPYLRGLNSHEPNCQERHFQTAISRSILKNAALAPALVLAVLWGSVPLIAQDMALSDVLLDGEGWTAVAEGYGFTDGAATDAEGNFYFADVAKGDKIHKIAADGTLSVFAEQATRISGMQFGPDGKIYACQGGQPGKIVAFETSGERSVIASDVEPNDLVVTARGGIYFTETGKAQVTFIATGQSPVKAGTGPLKPNGIALSLDQETLAVSDYAGPNVWAWRIANDGKLEFAQPYMSMQLPLPPSNSGPPTGTAPPRSPTQPSHGDGMATDAAGRYYVTSAVGLQMFDPTGRLCGVIQAPQAKPLVSVEFSGPDLSYLYVCCGDKIYRRKTKVHGVLYFKEPGASRN